MKLLAWNCRGLGNPCTVRELHLLVKEKVPQVVFISETKCNRERVEKIRNKLGLAHSFVVESRGKSGGLAMMWSENTYASLFSYSRHHNSLELSTEEGASKCHVTSFYGDSVVEKRRACWDLLRVLRPDSNCPWLCMGDFNELLSNEEKYGAPDRPFLQMERFREALDECELSDLGFLGSRFTWSNKREGRAFIKERLDRAFGNSSWSNIYEAFWSKKQECKDIIKRTWYSLRGRNSSLENVQHALESSMVQLQAWAKRTRGNQRIRIKEKTYLIQHMQKQNTGELNGHIKALQEEVDAIMEDKELKKVNLINRITDDRGNWATNPVEVGKAFQSYYENLFSSSNPTGCEEALQVVNKLITHDMNQQLMKRCSVEEVRVAVFDMNPFGSPGPDGFSAGFYQDNWQIVGEEVSAAVQEILENRRGVAEINETYIALIPKKKLPTLVLEYRPISLLAYETMHSMKHRMRGKKEGYMALKLDMSKAYDRIEWSFLEAILIKMGFSKEWTELSTTKVLSKERFLTRGPTVPLSLHLMLGDDSLLFCKANALEWSRLFGILKTYENASGQRFNMEKKAVYFSYNTRVEFKEVILAVVGLEEAKSNEKYLGLPAYAGKEVLLKSVIQAIPTYCMSIFKLPKAILNAINSLMQKFWWGMKGDRSKVRWLSWKTLGSSKEVGGLGYREFENFNVALLAKQGREVLSEGMFWCIGNGHSVRIWKDKWIPRPTSFKVQSLVRVLDENSKVCSQIDQQRGEWKEGLIHETFNPEESEMISRIPISITNANDNLIWRCTKDGSFSVKSAYHLLGAMVSYNQGQSSSAVPQNKNWSMEFGCS
ncbi:uncharacterized protein LOC122316263 [Carya illinoinensis]|uniref:uncharacterized protein LOC122316263 n=1 Tax=Carya illinoinensis TaxID=32201 RepID=UPI001C7295AA|nr:uncharacterized protein LOC122316263 [Carya illinoinensis]